MDLLRLGIVGAGNICNGAHLPAYVSNKDQVAVRAIYDLDRRHAEETRENYLRLMREAGACVDWEIDVCVSPEELLEKVDLVDICTSLKYHAHYAAMALRKGVHAMSEKPMARTWPEAMDVVAAEEQTDAFYQLNDDNIFLPRFQHFRNAVASGMAGDITELWISRGTHSSDRNTWFYNPVEAGGGCILDYGSHAVAAACFILGFGKKLEAVRSLRIGVKERTRVVRGRLQEISVDDDAHFKALFSDPQTGDWSSAVIECTWAYPEFGPDSSDTSGFLVIRGSEGVITGYFDDAGQEYIRISRYAGGEFSFPIKSYTSEAMSFAEEIRNFCVCIREGRRPFLDAKKGARTIQIINMAQLSETLDRKAVTPALFESFVQEHTASSPLKTGDALAEILTAPYLLSEGG
ncbi:MAG: Gfo/Idh/MocA family oxidoreductase [Oscillospiraceae bacterium]|nr:Gfo/Idh/MocA family oxidoreductase [Oscillospiraceae bacterium]